MLTPFMKAVMKALSIELEEGTLSNEKKQIVYNDILQNLPADYSTSNFGAHLSSASDTLRDEFDLLIDLQ